MEEEAYKADLKAQGVDIPEEAPAEEAPKEEPKVEAPVEEKKPEEAPLQEEPKEQRKRSIYDEYKEKKLELRTETERREQAERERDELKEKLAKFNDAETPEEKKEAADDLEAFAQEINANPEALRKMREIFLKDVKPQTDAELQKRLERFEAWEKQNAPIIEQQMFEKEYQSSLPKLQKLFPGAKDEEMTAIKAELDKLSHTKDWHDKPLAFIAFENQDTLSALISPKKRGMESKDKKDVIDETFEFDPNPDFSKMTPAQIEQWEAAYTKATSSKDVMTDGQGRKLIL
jgi:hypothetical protein